MSRLPGSSRASAGASCSSASLSVGRFAGQPSEDLRERHVGQRIAGEIQAMADEHLPARGPRPALQLGEQAGLADAGIAGEQHRAAAAGAVAGEPDQAREGVELLGTPDQAAGLRGRLVGHRTILAVTCDDSTSNFAVLGGLTSVTQAPKIGRKPDAGALLRRADSLS